MGHDSVNKDLDPLQARRSEWIETFRRRSHLDLRAGWHRLGRPEQPSFLQEPWGREHRPDWAERGLLIWPRGRQWLRLEQCLRWPEAWGTATASHARLVLSWWAESMRLWVDGELVHQGDLFDTACRWPLPERFQAGMELRLELELCSPGHDDGALISSALCLEPRGPRHDPDHSQTPEALLLHLEAGGSLPPQWQHLNPAAPGALEAVVQHLHLQARPKGGIHWIGHAHLDLAWLWPVADTWCAAERTFRSALELMQRNPELRFAHSTPALYAWLQKHRPSLFEAVRRASRAGSWEPVNGPWVETDCVLVSTASLWRQFQVGQAYSHETFPEWSHSLAWLPDSFGFGAGLPAVAARCGVRWFCTHKLAWNAENPFPHRLFRWRSRGGGELLSLMLPPIGRRGDPMEMLREQRAWHQATGLDTALWIPGVGDHGGGPTEEMLDQLRLWEGQRQALPQHAGTIREFLDGLEPAAMGLPVWRDELYLELHRGCATSRPDQKRHNRTLERLLREADVVASLLVMRGGAVLTSDWRPLLFQQFHDILPGTSIPEVFDQAEPVWTAARRQARTQRDSNLRRLFAGDGPTSDPDRWAWIGLQPLALWSTLVRLPLSPWQAGQQLLQQQPAAGGGVWVQLPRCRGVASIALERPQTPPRAFAVPRSPVEVTALDEGRLRVGNGRVAFDLSALGLLQLRGHQGRNLLDAPLQLGRFRDRGEFWDAWDLASDYRDHPLTATNTGTLDLLEDGPLSFHAVVRQRQGRSALRMDVRLQADRPWLELICSIDWRQRHELLRLELSLAQRVSRYAADTSGGVLERPARPCTRRESARWEVPVISWFAAQEPAPGGGLAVLLDGPQGVDGEPERMGVSLLRGPTWPDPSADAGLHRQRLALMPLARNWREECVPQAAIAFREPGWCGPLPGARSQDFLPALPADLVPLSMRPHNEGVLVQLFNPGSSRCLWRPGDPWRFREVNGDVQSTDITLAPGVLMERVLFQSS